MIKKVIAYLCSLITVFSLCACNQTGTGDGSSGGGTTVTNPSGGDTTENYVYVTTAGASEKVLRKEDYTGNATLEINAFKNEYESAQVIIRPEKAVKEYTVSVGDFKHENNVDKLSKDLFEVYHEKYIEVNTVKNTSTSMPVGEYPDALLPFETAIEYGENCIAADNNQAVWIAIKVPKDAKAGVYSGKVQVVTDGKTTEVPASIQVYNFAISDENHVKSSYGIYQDEIAWGELDSTDEMFEKYVDFFLDFRISSQHLPTSNSVVGTLGGTVGNELYEEKKAEFIEMAVKYAKDVRCSNYNIPVQTVSATYPDGTQNTGLNTVTYRDYLIEMAKASIRENVDLFAKAGTYLIYFDEAVVNNKMHVANYNLRQINELHDELGAEILSILQADATLDLSGKDEFVAKVIDSMNNVKHKLVGSHTSLLEDGISCQYVPTIDQYHTESNRELYEQAAYDSYGEDGELWSYHCMNPYAPYPTVHIDDHLISSRLMGWMMGNYNIVGSLYWDTTLYAWRKGSTGDLQLQDFYDTALRFPQANGDGFLVYPGRPYGIYGPVASVRLWSLRDGFEDYELLYSLKQMYLQRGYTSDWVEEIINILVNRLYSGTKVNYTDTLISDFSEARETLAQLLEFAQNGVYINDIGITDTSARFGFMAGNGTKLYNGAGAELNFDGNQYTETVTFDQSKPKHYLQVTCVTATSESYSLKLYLGGGRVVVGVNDIDSVTTVNSALTKAVDGSNINVSGSTLGSAYIDMQFGALSLDAVSVIELTVYSSEAMTVKLLKNGYTSMAFAEYDNITLNAGQNTLRISISALSLNSVGGLKTIRLRLQTALSAYQLQIQKVVLIG